MPEHDRRLIEDYLPIEAISAEASREKSVRKGHISTLPLWWARRPLVACRAAVYGALVPASRFIPQNGPEEKQASLGRANAAKFMERLCKYPGNPRVIAEAQRHILEAHAERLSHETGKRVTVEDIEAGRAPRPKVLDMFAGGGAIPLEALRLECEAYALDLNPVAHIIELCTLVYPQKYGKPDSSARGMTGPKNARGETTWGGLAKEVRYWGTWVLEKVRAEIGDLYPLIPDPTFKGKGVTGFQPVQKDLFVPQRNLPHWQMGGSTYFVTFRTVNLELPPEARKLTLNACRHFDGQRYTLWAAVITPDHVHLLLQPKEIEAGQWWSLSSLFHSVKSFTSKEINKLLTRKGSVWQDESCDRIFRDEQEFLEKWNYIRNNPVNKGLCKAPEEWDGFYECTGKMPMPPRYDAERAKAVGTYLATAINREAEDSSSLCRWNPNAEKMQGTFGRQALPMVWDFCEINPFGDSVGDWSSLIDLQINGIEGATQFAGLPATVSRGSGPPRSSGLMPPSTPSSPTHPTTTTFRTRTSPTFSTSG
jgi:REP element-mobilizing transposase RayT